MRAGRRRAASSAPSFVSTAATWCSAVRGETTSRSAISAFVSPSARSASTSSWRAVSPAGFARVASRGPVGHAQPELAHAPGHAPGQRLGAEPAGDLERLGERLLVVEQRQHQRPVVGPADLAERVGRAAPVAPEHRGVRRRHRRRRRRTSIPATAAHAASAHREPAGAAAARPDPRRAARTARPASARRVVSAHSAASSRTGTIRCSSPVRSASARELGQPLGGVRVAAPDGQLGENRLREQLRRRCRVSISRRVRRSASSHSPARRRSHAITVAE